MTTPLQSPGTGWAGHWGPNAIITANGTPLSTYAPTIVETPDGVTAGATPTFYTDWTRTTTTTAPETDSNGNLSFWVSPGLYLLTFTLPGASPTTFQIVVDPFYPDAAWNVPTQDTAGSATPSSGDVRLANAVTGAVTETLPAPLAGSRMRIIKVDTSTNPVYINVTGGSGILGADLGAGYGQQAEVAIFGYGTCYEFVADNTNWHLITPRRVGIIEPWAGSGAAPSGSFLCQGQAISRTVYADLFGVIGTNFGAGDGSTTFNLPDARSVSLIGVGTGTHTGVTARALGSFYGAESLSLAAAQLPPLTATVTEPNSGAGHAHYAANDSGATKFFVQPTSGTTAAYINGSNLGQPGTLEVSESGTTWYQPTGITVTIPNASQTVTPTVTPALGMNFIIWAQ